MVEQSAGTWAENSSTLLTEFGKGLRMLHRGHWEAARVYQRRARMLGIPVTVLTAAVGTALFSSLDSMSKGWQVTAGLVSMLAAVLAALQTFLKLCGARREAQASRQPVRGVA